MHRKTTPPVSFMFAAFAATIVMTCTPVSEQSTEGGEDLPQYASVVMVIGDVHTLIQGRENWQKLKPGGHLASGDIIKTGVESQAVVELPAQGTVYVNENSLLAVTIEDLPDGVRSASTTMKFGAMLADMHKMVGSSKRFTVNTPTATASIRGTSFRAYVDRETGESQVMVLHGKVAVKKRDYKQVNPEGAIENDLELEKRAQREVDENDVQDVLDMMTDLSHDWEQIVERQIIEERVKVEKQMTQECKEKKLPPEVVEWDLEDVRVEAKKEVDAIIPPENNRMVVKGMAIEVAGTIPDKPRPITNEEMAGVREEFTKEVIDRAENPSPPVAGKADEGKARLDLASVQPGAQLAEGNSVGGETNAPPRVTSTPPLEASIGATYTYRMKVADDQDTQVRYRLVEGPTGMRIDSRNAEVLWKPRRSGVANVEIEITDSRGAATTHEFVVTIGDSIRAGFAISPPIGDTATNFVFKALDSASQNGNSKLRYRWDFDGDGTWDFPRFGKTRRDSVSYTFPAMGTYAARMEVVDHHGSSRILEQRVTVDQSPRAVVTCDPSTVLPGKSITFDASQSTDNADGLRYRWDFDEDGVWDYPQDGYTTRPTVSQRFYRCYTGPAIVEVIDRNGLTSKAMVPYKIGYPCRVYAKPDKKVNMATPSLLVGEASDSDDDIVEYAWDFDADGEFDWRSKETGTVSHLYGVAGKHQAIFMAKSADGSVRKAAVAVEVYNAPPQALPGKDMVVPIGKEIEFNGAGFDEDGTIVKYEWDFNGDKRFDYVSDRTGTTTHTYPGGGEFTAVLRVTSKDGLTDQKSINVSVIPRMTYIYRRVKKKMGE